MKILILRLNRLICTILLAVCMAASSVVSMSMQDPALKQFRIEDFRWNNRLLLVFAASPGSADLKIQTKRLKEDLPALGERDMVIITILGEGQSSVGSEPLNEAAAKTLRKQFKVNDDHFAVILIGKDGTEKLRSSQPFSMEQLFSTIDAMPMRQGEMRKRKS